MSHESTESTDDFVVAQVESRKEVDCRAELPSMLAASPNKVRVPLEISVIVALLTRHLCIDVDRFVNQPIRASAAGCTDIQCDWSCRGSIRSGYVFLGRDSVGPLRSRCVALAYPAEPECSREL